MPKCDEKMGGCWIQKALKNKGVKHHPRGEGTLTTQAKLHNMTVKQFAKEVDKNPEKYKKITKQRVNLYKSLKK